MTLWHHELSLSLPPFYLLITLSERRLRLLQRIGHPLIGRRNRPPRTCLRDLLQEPPSTSVSRGSSRDRCDQRSCRRPRRNRRRSDWTDPSLRCGLERLICGGGGSCPVVRTERERNQECVMGSEVGTYV